MEIIYSVQAIEDLKYWKKSGNKLMQKKISALITAIEDNPLEGIGKPEALKHELSGFYSRRINQEHRIIYKVTETVIRIETIKGHY
jgi:toxin YoeB